MAVDSQNTDLCVEAEKIELVLLAFHPLISIRLLVRRDLTRSQLTRRIDERICENPKDNAFD